jgi:hypothetical protein
MVTEEEVRAYRVHFSVHADGRDERGRFFMWAGVCRENPRVVLTTHSRRGDTYIVDGVPLRDGTPAGVAQALNTQTSNVLSVMDALQTAAKKEDE